MTRRWLFAPIIALSMMAGYLGLRLGQPLTETDIITRYAGVYVGEAGMGAQMTDCLAAPNIRQDVRLVVLCTHPDGTVYSYFSGPRGELRPATDPQEPQA